MDTRLKDIISKENRNALYAFLGAQTFNIIVTFFVAWLMFGIVKPALEGDKGAEAAATEQVAESPATTAAAIPTEPAATESEVEVTEFEKIENQE